ncbi:MAG: class I tRNA ligase family protein [Bacteroidota bacterium]
MNFKEYKQVDYAQIADEILSFWEDENIFEKSISTREGKPTFTFYEGPPSANGTPGIHHVMARAIKDIFCRYQTLKGKQVYRKGGWDTHGLPIELQVEKELGITKEDIGKTISVEEYNQKCRETVMRFTDQWQEMTDKMGYWVDMEKPYVTYENNYIESVWYLLKTLYNKGLLYKGYTIQPYSPAAGTGLSSHELNMPGTYQDVKDTSITAQFKVIKNSQSEFLYSNQSWGETFILAWTTTPWTLPSNSALTVGKNIEYAIVKTYNPYTYLPINVILAKDLVTKQFHENGKEGDFESYKGGDKIIPWKIISNVKGSELEGVEYEQLMPYVAPPFPDGGANKGAFRIIIGDFVTTEDGTGVVHTAPTFGADDFKVAQQNGVPPIMVKDENGKDVPLVDLRGKFVAEVADYAHEYVKEAYLTEEEKEIERKRQGRDKYLSVDERIAIKLKTENKAFNVQRYEHTYPHCWRTDKPVLYYPLDSWFIRTTAIKDKLIELNKTINWKPESTGTGRFGNWLENLVDWNLSRSRYWGTPLPIWRSDDHEEVCIGSVEELVSSVKHALKDDVLSEQQREKNLLFLERYEASILPHPQPHSNGEGSVASHVFTSDHKNWKILKPFAQENRKNQTETERIIWELVRNNNLGFKFRRQHTIGQYIVDFVCISKQLVIEIDGEIHQINDNPEYDKARTEFLNSEGFQVIRFSNDEVLKNKENVSKQIQQKLNESKEMESPKAGSPLNRRGAGGEVLSSSFDLHRPFVDEIYLVSASGKLMIRETDLIDVWFDSGAMPYAQWHYPFENSPLTPDGGTKIASGAYPADFISEGVDQTRGWFFTLHAISAMVSDSVAFKNVVSTGLVLDKNGNKMSKRLGNAVDPFETLKKYGADPTRWYMITNAQPWDNLKFDLAGITEVRNKFFGTLTNTYNFFALYANLDNYKLNEFDRLPIEKLSELDRWIISKLQSLIKNVDESYADYEPTKAGRAIQEFVTDHLSNWYVRLGRRRFWMGQMTDDKKGAYETLQHCLVSVAQLMAPIAPFYADWLYKNMTDHNRKLAIEKSTPLAATSVHLTDFQSVELNWIDQNLEESMELAQRICSLVHSMRKANRLKVRQPLAKILIPVLSKKIRKQISSMEDIIKTEVNIKEIEYLSDASGVLSKKVKPNFKTLGPHFGKDMKFVAAAIQNMTEADLATLETTSEFLVPNSDDSAHQFRIHLDDVEIITEDLPGFISAKENDLIVALDIEISPILKQEGIARDFVNRVQNFRKDTGFEVTDKINIQLLNTNPDITEGVIAFKEYISTEVQANTLEIVESLSDFVEVEMDEIVLKWNIIVANK